MKKLTDKQRKALNAALSKMAEEERKAKMPPPGSTSGRPTGSNPRGGSVPTPPRGGAPQPPRGGGYRQAQDSELFREAFASGSRPGYLPGGPGPNGYPRGGYAPYPRGGEYPGGGVMPVPQAPIINNAVNPIGLNPDKDGNFNIWAHDETVEPGKTYVYRMRVLLKNPVYERPDLVDKKNIDWTKQAFIPADDKTGWTEWSKPVTIAPNVEMQFVKAGAGKKIGVKIRRWQAGKYTISDSMAFEPGDMIAGKIDGTDYSTGWTVVDVRTISNDTKVRLIDKDGRVLTRSTDADAKLPNFTKPPPETIGKVNGALGSINER
jgi:hypothetical protein